MRSGISTIILHPMREKNNGFSGQMNKLVGKSLEIEQLLTPGPASALVGMWAASESAEKSMGVLGDGPDLFIMLNAEKLVFFALPLESKERCFQKVLIVLISLLIW